MNKAERIKAIENELAWLRAELEQESKENWRAEKDEYYWFVGGNGKIHRVEDTRHGVDNCRFELGNYFRTEEEAKNSPYYFMLNSEYFYWFPDMPKPKETPKDAEYFSFINAEWHKIPKTCYISDFNLVRYPKHYKGGDK